MFFFILLNNAIGKMAEFRVNKNGGKKNFSKTERGLFISAILIIFTSAYFLYNHKEKGFDCKKGISKIIKQEPEYYKNSAIYLIYYLNKTCCNLAGYETIKSYPNLRIIFLFIPDYSDADIQNFKRVFNIDEPVDIRRMDYEWHSLYLKCTKNRWNINLNFFILVINNQIVDIRSF
ncbi:MAG: hypothetical protein C0168_06715 [Candidatus Aminicenantes bacterium]|nr:MAG: hypothetical protein C0168_06715 [Candidatus Aminicenantes bacterium]